MKTIVAMLLMLIPFLGLAQIEKTYKFERSVVLRLQDQDTTKYDFVSMSNKCGKFVIDDVGVQVTLEGEQTTSYLIKRKVIRILIDKAIVYNVCIDILSEEQIVVYVNDYDKILYVGKFNEGKYYLYLFFYQNE